MVYGALCDITSIIKGDYGLLLNGGYKKRGVHWAVSGVVSDGR